VDKRAFVDERTLATRARSVSFFPRFADNLLDIERTRIAAVNTLLQGPTEPFDLSLTLLKQAQPSLNDLIGIIVFQLRDLIFDEDLEMAGEAARRLVVHGQGSGTSLSQSQ
jgi:hypothetical protein